MMSLSSRLTTNVTFTDIYDNAEAFVNDYKASGLYDSNPEHTYFSKISDDSATTLYYLLYAKYGNSSIRNWDETQFKYKLFSTIFMYGPSWEKRLEVQGKLRALDDDALTLGAKQIFNHSYNPSTAPSTDTLEELLTIDNQNVTKNQRSKLDAYNLLLSLLETDVTNEFLNKFKPLFMQIGFDEPDIFITEIEE